MSEDLDLLIEHKEKELHSLTSSMEEFRQQFIEDATEFASRWYEETAKEYVKKYPKITLGLSKEKLVALKTSVNSLSKNAGEPIRMALSSPTVWWHLKPNLHDDFSQYEQLGNESVGSKFPEKIDKAIRIALGELGAILEQFGFNVTIDICKKSSFPEFWFTPPEKEGARGNPFYPHVLDWSVAMKQTLHKYDNHFKQAILLYNEIQKLKEEKEKQQVTQLWDST